jgi:uncharacterized membrane protein
MAQVDTLFGGGNFAATMRSDAYTVLGVVCAVSGGWISVLLLLSVIARLIAVHSGASEEDARHHLYSIFGIVLFGGLTALNIGLIFFVRETDPPVSTALFGFVVLNMTFFKYGRDLYREFFAEGPPRPAILIKSENQRVVDLSNRYPAYERLTVDYLGCHGWIKATLAGLVLATYFVLLKTSTYTHVSVATAILLARLVIILACWHAVAKPLNRDSHVVSARYEYRPYDLVNKYVGGVLAWITAPLFLTSLLTKLILVIGGIEYASAVPSWFAAFI